MWKWPREQIREQISTTTYWVNRVVVVGSLPQVQDKNTAKQKDRKDVQKVAVWNKTRFIFASYCGILSNFLHAVTTTDLIPHWILLHIIFRVNPLKKNVWCTVTVGTVTLSAIPTDVIVLQVRFLTPSCRHGCSNTNNFCNAQFGSLIERPARLCNEKSVENNRLHWTRVAQQFKKGVSSYDVCAVFNGEVIW